jgi:hypothetical protein
MARVTVSVEETTLENDDGLEIDGIIVTCSKCGESVEAFGTEEASVKYACATLHEGCCENNWYVHVQARTGDHGTHFRANDKIEFLEQLRNSNPFKKTAE